MSPGEPSGTVLVVDDDQDIREIVSEVLSLRGYDVAVATDGRQALQWLAGGGRACIILLDLMMPDMNGWEFREAQLRDPELADIPVVVLSGVGNPPAYAEALAADQILPKPVDLTGLTEAVARFC